MNKYDAVDNKEKYLQSDEYKKQQEEKQQKDAAQALEDATTLQQRLEELDAEKAAGLKMIGNRQANAAEDDEFLQGLFTEYA